VNRFFPTSEYPKALLRDDVALLVLTVLESLGLSNESSLAAASGLDESAVNRSLLHLYQDKMVEYGRNHVRVAERGKWLIDTFDLSSTLLESFDQGLHLTDPEAEVSFRGVLEDYRNAAYPQYLNTVSTCRVWWRLMKPPSQNAEPAFEEAKRRIALAFLVRDMRNWCLHEGLAIERLKSAKHLLDLFSKSDLKFGRASEGVKNAWKLASSLDEKNFQFGLENDFVFFFIRFSRFQEKSALNIWFDDWNALEPKLESVAERTRRGALESTFALLEHKAADEPSWEAWFHGGRSAPTDLFLLLSSNYHFDEIVLRTGQGPGTVRGLLEAIKTRCTELLKENEPATIWDQANTMGSDTSVSQEQIRKRAYELYTQRGGARHELPPSGSDTSIERHPTTKRKQ
jgi:hypothetical protein